MGRKRAFSWRGRALAALLLAVLAGGGWLWWQAGRSAPPRDRYPVQGVLIGAADGTADFAALRAVGADFAYLEASDGAGRRDPTFARNLAQARGSGLRIGAVHAYDPCVAAERQAANFVTSVPRDPALLPPAIALVRTAQECNDPVSETALESELTTFLNQVEGHAGQPAVLLLSEAFEARYGIAASIDRPLWLESDLVQPDYAGRPWALWTANSRFSTAASEQPLRWVVVQP